MDDILSQIIAYAPDKIDTDVKLRSLVQAPLTMAQVPRSEMDNFNTPDLEQAPDQARVREINESIDPNITERS